MALAIWRESVMGPSGPMSLSILPFFLLELGWVTLFITDQVRRISPLTSSNFLHKYRFLLSLINFFTLFLTWQKSSLLIRPLWYETRSLSPPYLTNNAPVNPRFCHSFIRNSFIDYGTVNIIVVHDNIINPSTEIQISALCSFSNKVPVIQNHC